MTRQPLATVASLEPLHQGVAGCGFVGARPGLAWRGMARQALGMARQGMGGGGPRKNRPAPSAFPECVWPCGLAWRGMALARRLG